MSETPFFQAIASGNHTLVSGMLSSDRHLADIRNHDGVSPVLYALYTGQPEIAEGVAEEASELDVHDLAGLGRAETLALRLDEKPQRVHAFSPDGFQPLHLAAFFAREAAMAALIARGADVNAKARAEAGMAPIHSAAASRRSGPVKILIEAGADVDAAQLGGHTALMSAARHGNLEMTEALLAAGADPSKAADDGRRPADFARAGGHEPLAARLER
jgi:uncharacterized protein